MKNFKKIIILCAACVLAAGAVKAETGTFIGRGKAVVINKDRGTATKIAYQSAKKKALTEAMRSFIYQGRKDEVNFNRKKPQLLKGPFPYIQSERQVSNNLQGKLLNIAVEIKVDMKGLERFLGKEGVLVTENKQKKKSEFPDIMVIISEEISGTINTVPYTTALISDYLIKKEFEVIDENIVRKNISQEQAVQAVSGNMAAANAVALQYGAGIILTGKTAVQQSSLKFGGMQSYGANITLRAIKADTGDVLAAASADGSFPHINAMTGSRKAAEQAARKAVQKIVKDLENSLESTSNGIIITINPVNYKQLAIFKKILKRDFQDISGMKQKSFISKVAKLDIQYEGGIAYFADEVALKDFGTFTLEVIQFSPGKIDLKLQMK